MVLKISTIFKFVHFLQAFFLQTFVALSNDNIDKFDVKISSQE